MCIDINKEYERNYNNLTEQEKRLVDDSLQQVIEDNHINICSECAIKYFAPTKEKIDFTQTFLTISDDYAIDNNVCDGVICECGECQNEADYTINLIEKQ